jgi:hypothetical protein
MKKIHDLIIPGQLQRSSVRSLIFTLTFLGLIVSNWGFSAKVMAQNPKFNSTEITSYAQALLAMEPIRQEAFASIKKAMNDPEVPKIVCSEPNSINSLPNEARKIAINYCNRSQKIVEESGLTIEKFNRITVEVQNNSELKRQVYNTLLRLQKAPETR